MLNKIKNGKLILVFVVGSLAAFYFANLPVHVQGGDTGELVASGFKLFVAHPPGYPLWIWLQNAFTHALGFGSVFWRASLLNSLFACATLFFVGMPLTRNPVAILVCVPILGLSAVFIESALLPDVFSLHGLLVAVIGFFYLFSKKESKRFQMGVPLLFTLGVAHHLTVVFLLPVIFGVIYETRKVRKTVLGLGVGFGITFLLYASILLFKTESSFSWGSIRSLQDVWHHFLRSDYGTFRLAADKKLGGIDGIWFFLRSLWIELLGFTGLGLVAFLNRKKNFTDRFWIWGVTCILSISFFLAANVTPIGMGEEVLRRFCLMPVVQLSLLTSFLLFNSQPSKQYWLAIGVIGLLGLRTSQLIGFHNDSVFEDYSVNLLVQAARHKPALILTENDNAYFGMRYVQAVLNKNGDIGVASSNLFFHPWYLRKIQLVEPSFHLSDPEKIWSTRNLSIEKDLIDPNSSSISLIFTRGFQDGKNYHSTFLGLGRLVKSGSGLEFDDSSQAQIELRTQYKVRPSGPQSYSRALLYAEYSHFFLAQGLTSYSTGKKDEAIKSWKAALERVPYAFPALTNLCSLAGESEPQCLKKNIAEIQGQAKGLF